jgi:Domain of unknown function (DUF6378)
LSWSAVGRDEILRLAREAVTDRGLQYGKPEDSFERIAVLWNAWLKVRKPGPIGGLDVALMMLLFKVGRIAGGNRNHIDNYIDIAGYASCAGELVSGSGEESRE